MPSLRIAGLAAVAVIVTVLALPSLARATQGISGAEALADLNAWRAQAGESPVTVLDPEMSEGCRLHNLYSAATNTLDHAEEYGPAYTALGDDAADSSALAGWSGPVDMGGPRHFWEDAVYHRVALLQPRMVATWWSSNDGYACMGVRSIGRADGHDVTVTDNSPASRTAQLAAYPWPSDGAQNVDPAPAFSEHSQAIPGQPDDPGFALTISFNGPWASDGDARLTQWSLTPDGGAPVALAPQDAGTRYGYALDGGGAVGLFPVHALAPDTWYTAHAAGVKHASDDLGQPMSLPFDVTWRFRTGALAPGTNDRGDWDVDWDVDNNGLFTEFVVASTDPPLTVTVRRHGRTVATTTLRYPRHSWNPHLTRAGRYEMCVHAEPHDGRPGVDECRRFTVAKARKWRLGLLARLRRGRVQVTVFGAPEASGRRVTVAVQVRRRACGKRRCHTAWRTRRTVRLRLSSHHPTRRTVKLPRRVGHVRVRASVPAFRAHGDRYRRAVVTRVIGGGVPRRAVRGRR